MRKAIQGFTVIEIMIVVSIIGILSSIGIVSYVNVQKNSRDQQRLSSATIITEAIEKYYDKNGNYPTYEDISNLSKAKTTLGINDDSVLFAPKADRAVSPIASEDLAGNVDVFSYYIDNPANGTWKFQYICEKNGNTVKSIASRRTPPTIAWETPVVSAKSKSSSEIVLEWSPILHATSYKYKYFKNCVGTGTEVSVPGNINRNTVTGLDSGTKYCFSISGVKDTRSSPFSVKENAVAITAPDKPTLSNTRLDVGKIKVDISGGTCNGIDLTSMYSVSSKKGNGSWSEFSEWTLASAFDSGIIPNPGDTYSFKAKARCTVLATGPNSVASAESNTIDFSAEVVKYRLTINSSPAGVGTFSGSGSYAAGAKVNATVSSIATKYYFSHWLPADCATIFDMPSSNKICTAYFTEIAAPSAASISVATTGKKYSNNLSATWTWGATCQANTNPKYFYDIQKTFPNYDSGWIPSNGLTTTTNTYTFNDSSLTINREYIVFFKARCEFDSSHYGDWYNFGGEQYTYKSINTSVSPPTAVAFSRDKDPDTGNVILYATPDCSTSGWWPPNYTAGNLARYDVYSSTNAWVITKNGTDYIGTGNWWSEARLNVFKDGNNNIWANNDWDEMGIGSHNALRIIKIMLIGTANYPETTKYGVQIEPKCQNKYGFQAYDRVLIDGYYYPKSWTNMDIK